MSARSFFGRTNLYIKFRGALLRPPIPRPMTEALSKSKSVTVKFVDDGSVATSIDLKSSLKPDLLRERPLNYHERTEHNLPQPDNLLQHYMQDLEQFAELNNLKVNQGKTQVMLFNKARKWDFPPEINYKDGPQVKITEETKLVGVMVSSNLKWESNTRYICVIKPSFGY